MITEQMNWQDVRQIVLTADKMLSEEDLQILKFRGEKAYYEEVLRRSLERPAEAEGKRVYDFSRDGSILFALRNALAEEFGMSYQSMMDGIRKREVVEMRYLVFLVVRDFSRATDSDFARLFPTYNRVTIIYHSLRKAKELMEVDANYRAKYLRLRNAVEGKLKKMEVI